MLRLRGFAILLMLGWSATALPVRGQGTAADYERSNKLSALSQKKVFHDRVSPNWLADNKHFWYRNELPGGKSEYVLVDAERGERKPAFDHALLAQALTKAMGKEQRGDRLPLERLNVSDQGETLRFQAGGKHWKCDVKSYALTEDPEPPPASPQPATTPRRPRENAFRQTMPRPRSTSPDGKWIAFVKDNNLSVRPSKEGKTLGLSKDGTADESYSERVYWSPDSKKLVSFRTKKAQEHKVYLIESSPRDQLQPKLQSMEYLKPGDRIAVSKPHLFDVEAGKEIAVSDELFAQPWSNEDVRWSSDSRQFTFVYNQRGHQVLRIVAVDATDGKARAIVDEQSKTFLDYSGKFFAYYLDATHEIIWMSERDGWNHLYLCDAATGKVKKQLTKGPWVVRGVDRVDEKTGQIWFRAGGYYEKQDPYFIHYFRVNVDGSNLVALTEGDGTHNVEFSPDRRYLVDTHSRVDHPPVVELRRTDDGKLLCELERADAHALLETGWKMPEPFVAKGRDGTTDIYGVIFRPTNLNPDKKYPVIEQIYAGPQGSFVPKGFRAFYYTQQLAELGFIVVQIDGMGTNNRSKAFHDVCCKNLGDAGLPDRILWMKAAAKKYPYLDVERVGVYGGSAGGQNALGAVLNHPEFYKAASANCGCHDNRMDKIWWNELWMGWPIGPHYAEQSNVTNAHKLQGKLLLTVGEMDRNVDPASTMQVVNALIHAGKDFELLVVPGAGHGTPGGYSSRRERDFFVRHLLGVEPPNRNAIAQAEAPSDIQRTSFEEPAPKTEKLQTVAESSDYKATSRHADVVAFCEKLAKLSPLIRLGELGKSGEGRTLPTMILADPPVTTPEEAKKSGKLVVPPDQNEKIPLLRDIHERLRNLPQRGKTIAHVRPNYQDVLMRLALLSEKLQPLADFAYSAQREPTALLHDLRDSVRNLHRQIVLLPTDVVEKRLQEFEQKLAGDLAEDLHRLREVATPQPIALADLPPDFRVRYVGQSGKWLLRVFARESLWEFPQLEQFTRQIETVDPNATGKPFGTVEGLRAMKNGLQRAGIYAFFVIVAVLWLDFRSWKRTAVAVAPLVLAVILSLGILGLFRVPLNPANMIAFPLILGVGVDNGVHVLHDYLLRRREQAGTISYAIGRGVLIKALTTMLGFGTLMIASERGLVGLGLILTLGVGCSMLTALVLLPAVLHLYDTRRAASKEAIILPMPEREPANTLRLSA